MYRMIRRTDTPRADFVFYSSRIMRLIVEAALNLLPVSAATSISSPAATNANLSAAAAAAVNTAEAATSVEPAEGTIRTGNGASFTGGVRFDGHICGVSIVRAGEAMERALRECCRAVRIGKILIQRDDTPGGGARPRLLYDKLPPDVAQRWVLLLDPMLATGGSALMAVDLLVRRGVAADRILFCNLLAAPEGLLAFAEKYPAVRIVTAFIDQGLDKNKWVTQYPETLHSH
jgi:uracil phosphoribosyltransferase